MHSCAPRSIATNERDLVVNEAFCQLYLLNLSAVVSGIAGNDFTKHKQYSVQKKKSAPRSGGTKYM